MIMNASSETLAFTAQLGNASQVTLVDTTAYGTPHDVISFLRDNMRNTKIYSLDERLLYTVESENVSTAWTIIYRGDSKEVVAEVKRKDLRADRIKFGDNPSIKLHSWLRGDHGKWSDFPVSFEWDSSSYSWRTRARQIALYHEDNPTMPIAWFQTSGKQNIDGVPTVVRALLALQPEARAILDGIIVSLLVVEQSLRVRDDATKKTAGFTVNLHCLTVSMIPRANSNLGLTPSKYDAVDNWFPVTTHTTA